MKHRDVYTLEGGKNMQQTSLGRAVRYLVAVFVVLSSLALPGCPGDDDDDGDGDGDGAATFDITSAAVPVNSTTVAAVQSQAISSPLARSSVPVQAQSP